MSQIESGQPESDFTPEMLGRQEVPFYKRKSLQVLSGLAIVGGAFGAGMLSNSEEVAPVGIEETAGDDVADERESSSGRAGPSEDDQTHDIEDGMFGGNIVEDDRETADTGSPDEEESIEDEPVMFDPESHRLLDVSALDDHVLEVSDEIPRIISQMEQRDQPDVREQYRISERVIPFWRGNVSYKYYDDEYNGFDMLFVNPMEMIVDESVYYVGMHPESGEYITLKVGEYDAERDYLTRYNDNEMLRWSTKEDEYSGQFSVGVIAENQPTGVELIDSYSRCLRDDIYSFTPEVHIWDDTASGYDKNGGTYDDSFVYGVDDEHIFEDSRRMTELSEQDLQCDDIRDY